MARLAGLAGPPSLGPQKRRRNPAGRPAPQPRRQAQGLGCGSPPSPQLALRSWSRFEQDLGEVGLLVAGAAVGMRRG